MTTCEEGREKVVGVGEVVVVDLGLGRSEPETVHLEVDEVEGTRESTVPSKNFTPFA
jgi:hypothetical protein